MRNKLIILSFAFAFSFSTVGQSLMTDGSQEAKISIYPNPAVDFLMVQVEGEISNAEFELNSLIGNRVIIKPEEVGFNRYKIPVKDLATGYYFLVIKDDSQRFRKAFKFLKH